ncbi:MAG TPA: DUF4230 domain-containing protein [Phycisphaerae bacterium]|nr:DUF4230 domain-containing protein [Phycisphaerae bacterium]
MSHLVAIRTQIREPVALAAPCQRLGIKAPAQGKAKLHEGEVTGYLTELPGWSWLTSHWLIAAASQKVESLEQGTLLNAANICSRGFDHPDAGADRQLRYAHGNCPRGAANGAGLVAQAWRLALTVAGIVIVAVGAFWLLHPAEKLQPSPAPSLNQIQELQELVTHRVLVSKIHETRVAGYTGSMIVTIVVHGDVLVGVDLQRARILEKDENKRQMLLELPLPQIISPRLDHDQTYTQHVATSGLWCLVPGSAAQAAVVDRALREAQTFIGTAAFDPGIFHDAQTRTQSTIESFGKCLGWQVQVCWSRSP